MFKRPIAYRSQVKMIISASRRTDIPNYYHNWFFNRLHEGFALVRNPMNTHQVSKISLSPEVVDGVVFWTKNPSPMLESLNELKDYTYYFQFTLNAYGKDVEPNVPSKKDFVIPTFKQLSLKIGKERVVWRYDPIFFNSKYTVEYHCKYFEQLCSILHDYTEKCTVSFLDLYKKTERNIAGLNIHSTTEEQKMTLMEHFSRIANKYKITIDTCAEDINFERFGIHHAHCIDKKRIEKIGSFRLSVEKDKSQRAACGCVASIDIGSYNTCKNGCLYCYANFNSKIVEKNSLVHMPESALLFGEIEPTDIVKNRKAASCRDCQIALLKL